jgi:hypothetical protein
LDSTFGKIQKNAPLDISHNEFLLNMRHMFPSFFSIYLTREKSCKFPPFSNFIMLNHYYDMAKKYRKTLQICIGNQ